MKPIQTWITFINEKGEYDAIPFDLEKEQEMRNRGIKILGWPVFRHKIDAIEYIKGLFE